MKHQTFLADMQARKDAALHRRDKDTSFHSGQVFGSTQTIFRRQGYDKRFGRCAHCEAEFERINNGRPRKYCSDPCRELDRTQRFRGKRRNAKQATSIPF